MQALMYARSYIRRKRVEAKLIAQEVGKVIAQMFGAAPAKEDRPQIPHAADVAMLQQMDASAPPADGGMSIAQWQQQRATLHAAFKARNALSS